MTTILIVLGIVVLSLSVGIVFIVAIGLVRQNGRLLLRVDALEQALYEFGLKLIVRGPDRYLPTVSNVFLAAHPWLSFREESNDLAIFSEVVEENCYRLPPSFGKEDVVIDIGAHVGIFALAALERGCGEVHCFEPEPGNIARARQHLAPYGERASLTQAAVWRSDRSDRWLHFQPHADDPQNLGGGNVLHKEGREVRALTLDDILLQVSHGGKQRIRFLKLDCEGSEYPILLTSKLLHLVDQVSGEYHWVPDKVVAAWNLGRKATIEALASRLTDNGFDVELTSYETGSNARGMFFARRRT